MGVAWVPYEMLYKDIIWEKTPLSIPRRPPNGAGFGVADVFVDKTPGRMG